MFANETKVEKSKRRGKLPLLAKRGRRGELICGAFGQERKELFRTTGDAWAWTAWERGHSPELLG